MSNLEDDVSRKEALAVPDSGSSELTLCDGPRNRPTRSWDLPGERYQVLEEIARGGMGVVLRAFDANFGRTLAIKVLRPDGIPSTAAERRFLEEARITGQLQHPGIPPAHEVGRLADGRPFFSMKLIEGRTLDALLAERSATQLDLPRFLMIFEQIAQTLAYAHSQGVIHRDLKPLNIMVGAFGEVQVMDWGVAKRLPHSMLAETPAPSTTHAGEPASDGLEQTTDADPNSHNRDTVEQYTVAGEVLGTPTCMSREQARGEVEAVDERTDVFGLGAILCAILTGRPPYQADSVDALLKQARDADLTEAWAQLDACGADAELVSLAKACLAPNREDRPRDAGVVEEAMSRYLASVQERLQEAHVARVAAEVQAREERKRRRLVMGLAGAVILLIVGSGAAGLWYLRDQASQEAHAAERAMHLEREVSAALDESERQRHELHRRLQDEHQAARLLSDLEEWRQLLQSAQAAWRRADARAAADRDMLGPELRGRLAHLAEQLQADETDQRLAFELDRIRIESANLVEGQVQTWRACPQFARAFQDAGYNLGEANPAEIAARIRQSTIRLPLVAALDFWALLTRDTQLQGRLLEVARRADPNPWRDRFRQAEVWNGRSKLEALAKEVDCTQQSPQLLAAIAQRLRLAGGADEAAALVYRALVHHPRDFWLFFEVGHGSTNHLVQAGAFRAALAIRPGSAYLYYALGVILQADGKHDEALACYRRAVEIDPDSAGAQNNLGLVFDELHRPDEAMACYKKAITIDPNGITAHLNLGGNLQARNRLEDAIACYRKALAIDPKSPPALNNLGTALRGQGKLSEAIGSFRLAIEHCPNHAMAWCNLGHALSQQGEFRAGLDALRRGHALGTREARWSYPSAEWVKDGERWLALDEKLPAILRGEAAPGDAREQIGLASLCVNHRKCYAAAARFYAGAFQAQPELAGDLPSGNRYNAACAAALAAAGQGQDAAKLTMKERAELRRQAFDWLQADLDSSSKLMEKPTEAVRQEVRQRLSHWLQDPDLATLRGDRALGGLPEPERKLWQGLWAGVAELLESVGMAGKEKEP
jgi:serine/threonine-protein kinase